MAASATLIFVVIGTPIAWWLARTRSRLKGAVGEFGVALMIGGNIPGISRVASVQIYDHVEALEYAQAHRLSAIMIIFSFLVLLGIYKRRPNSNKG